MPNEIKQFTISGIVDVGMYNSILSPEVIFDDKSEEDWSKFSNHRYNETVRKQAELELKALFASLPSELNVKIVNTRIVSPKFYNYATDKLYTTIEATTTMTAEELQIYIEAMLARDMDSEFNAAYRIYEYITNNYFLEKFFDN